MNILVTGGTGFIGSRLALKCLERGDAVRVLGQENTEAESVNRKLIEASGAKVMLASVTDKEQVTAAVKDIDVVFHLAAAQHEVNVPDQHFWDINVTGTRNVLEASAAAGVRRVVHGSTIGVYGAAPEGTIDEHSPAAPDNIYGVTKLEGERLALSYVDRLPVVAIRISEVYGPGDRRLLKLFRAINKRTFVMIGNGENLHHPIYIDDLIEGFLLAASSEAAVGKVLVLAGKEPVTTNEMVETIARQLGTKVRGFRAPLTPFLMLAVVADKTCSPLGIQPPIHPRRMDFFRKSLVFSSNEASKTLGFVPKSGFEYGVRETAKWYREMGYL
jgi:nucleoside-diphosphate-sugar epimerase